jgi:outer membrane protein W
LNCKAQQWETGAAVGYGWYLNTSIGNRTLGNSVSAGFHPGWAAGAVFGDDMYKHVGGEIRYLYRAGSPQIESHGTRATMSGYTNTLTYDLLIHFTPRDSRIRPYVSAGAGIKIYTGTTTDVNTQPFRNYAVLIPRTQVDPAVSFGAGIKFRITKHTLLRGDFRTYMSPLPNQLFRTTTNSVINGWLYDFVPQLGVSYVF